ncbi:MAG: hypothetical protein IPG85_10015 [Bacteroidetes bacterium]|nr:hypothetical protein [Bacteroidota bacterium]
MTDANACTAQQPYQLIAPNAPTITINTTTPVNVYRVVMVQLLLLP